MTAIMTTLMPFNEEIVIHVVFCTDNMTNNIQYGVTPHYPSISEGATAKSLEGVVIGMGCIIGIHSMSQWRGGVHRDGSAIMYKGQSQRVCGTFVTQCGLDQIPGRECGGLRPPDAEAKCEIRVQFLTFSCTIV